MATMIGTIDAQGNVALPDLTLAGELCPPVPLIRRNVTGGFVVLDNLPTDFDVDAAIAGLKMPVPVDKPKAEAEGITDESTTSA